MKDKLLVNIVVPAVELNFDTYLPINKKMGTLKKILLNIIIDETDGYYKTSFEKAKLLDQITGQEFENNTYLYQSGIQNGSTIIFL